MLSTDLARTVAAIVCTVVFSATAIVGAVGPATQIAANDTNSTVAATARLTA